MALGNAGPMYCEVNVLMRPSSSPPISAPAGTADAAKHDHHEGVDGPGRFIGGEKGTMMPMTMPDAPAKAAETANVRP